MSRSALLLLALVTLSGCLQAQKNRLAVTAQKPALTDVALSASQSPANRHKLGQRAIEPSGVGVRLASLDEAPVAEEPIPLKSHSSHGALTLDDLESLALEFNPTLAQAVAAVDQERGVYRQAGLYPNPQVGYLNSTANQTAPKQSSGIFLSQEIVTANKLALEQRTSTEAIKRLEWDQEAQRIRVLNDIKIRFYEVLGAQQALEAVDEIKRLSEETLGSANALLEAKSISRPEMLQAKMQLETARISGADATHRYEAAWKQLKTMLGVPDLQPTPLDGELDEDIPVLDEESCWQRLRSESPQLRASESELDHGWAELRSSQAQAVPNVTLQTVTDYDRVTHSTTVSTLVALPLPLHNRNQGNIDKARADIRADQAEICRVELVLRDQLADSFRRYKTSRTQAERLKQEMLPSTTESLMLTKQAFEAGEVSFRDVLTAQQAYAETRLAYLEAVTELRKATVEIEGLQLTGGLNPAAIGSAIQNQPGGSSQRQRALLNDVKERASKQLLPAAQIGQ